MRWDRPFSSEDPHGVASENGCPVRLVPNRFLDVGDRDRDEMRTSLRVEGAVGPQQHSIGAEEVNRFRVVFWIGLPLPFRPPVAAIRLALLAIA
jgi:hypothetical protein